MKKIVEKHVTLEESVFKKLRAMAKREDRSMRAVLTRLIKKAIEERDMHE